MSNENRVEFDNRKILARIKEIYGTQEAFGKEMGWDNSYTSQKLGNLKSWKLETIYKALKVLRINPNYVKVYFFTPKT